MKKRFNVEGIDCANCAAKMEEKINKIPGVESAVLSFMAQKLTIECEPENLDGILNEAEKIMKAIDKEAEIVR
jgi:copper chaperone CopZ